MIDDDLQDWAASRRQPRPSPAEAVALVARWQQRSRRRLAWRTGLGFALAAAAVMVAIGLSAPAEAPPEVAVEAPLEAAPRELLPGRHVEDGDTIEVAEQSSVVVAAPGRLVLNAGTVHVEARPRPADAPLTITAGAAEVTVVGTRFAVTLAPFRVVVTEGTVRVHRDGEDHLVHGPGEFPPPPPAPRTLDELRALAIDGDMDEARAALRDHLGLSPGDADAWALLARVEDRSGRPRAAVRAWEAVVDRGRPSLARRARFELARLLEDEPRSAIPWLEAYLDDPGPWAPEARLRLGQAQLTIGDPAADETLRRVVADHPGTTAAASARALLGEHR